MDKKRKGMTKLFIALISVCLTLLTAGCETAKGTAEGLGYEAQGTVLAVSSTAQGVGRDTANTWGFIKKADDWIRKNLW
jgi:hypothetical protein